MWLGLFRGLLGVGGDGQVTGNTVEALMLVLFLLIFALSAR
jgi:hypothetical protein